MDKSPILSTKDFTGVAYVISRILSFPFWGLFYLLPIILYRDLHATPFQVATLAALKPVAALLSPYWSQRVHAMRKQLIPNLILANILKFSPFLFFPFINSPWFYIFAVAFHMFLCRGTIPAWMEVLKLKVAGPSRSKICAIGSTIDYLGVALLPVFIGGVLDNVSESWRFLFPITALLGMLSAWPIKRIKIDSTVNDRSSLRAKAFDHVLDPWKNGWKILKERVDFAKFQWGFFIGGAGLMVIHSILPIYMNDALALSYSDVLTAVAALKGIGFALSSPVWVKFFNRSRIFVLCGFVTCAAAIFPLLLIFAHTSSSIIYIAYLVYGVMQGGSELSWKLSGPLFAGEKDSTPFSSLSILAVGVRGLLFPYLGSLIFLLTGSLTIVLLCGMALSLLATVYFSYQGKRYPIRLNTTSP